MSIPTEWKIKGPFCDTYIFHISCICRSSNTCITAKQVGSRCSHNTCDITSEKIESAWAQREWNNKEQGIARLYARCMASESRVMVMNAANICLHYYAMGGGAWRSQEQEQETHAAGNKRVREREREWKGAKRGSGHTSIDCAAQALLGRGSSQSLRTRSGISSLGVILLIFRGK